jgi:hypothetical protein
MPSPSISLLDPLATFASAIMCEQEEGKAGSEASDGGGGLMHQDALMHQAALIACINWLWWYDIMTCTINLMHACI